MFTKYRISHKKQIIPDTFVYTLQPIASKAVFDFLPGQYTVLKNPLFEKPDEEHPFSIASSPLQKDSLEFCIKVYGDWTKTLSEAEVGQTVFVGEPRGSFLWDTAISYAVFMLGGIGVSPIMSMLRYMVQTEQQPKIVMLYGNRTPDTIAYKEELQALQQQLRDFRIRDIFSHLSDDHPWKGYRGFITPEIVQMEVTLSLKPTFFTIGPPVFITKMLDLLGTLGVHTTNIKSEDLSQT